MRLQPNRANRAENITAEPRNESTTNQDEDESSPAKQYTDMDANAEVENMDTEKNGQESVEEKPVTMSGTINTRKIYEDRDNNVKGMYRPDKDIGETTIRSGEESGDLKSDQQNILRGIHGLMGNAQVMPNKLECSPSWMAAKELQEEH